MLLLEKYFVAMTIKCERGDKIESRAKRDLVSRFYHRLSFCQPLFPIYMG